MLADSQFDIEIDSVGYTLLEESYRKRSQPSMNNRFSTGEYALYDLSFWQFIAQEYWTAGEGQEKMETSSNKLRYKDSAGWDMRNGKPRFALTAGNITPDISWPAPSSTVGQIPKVLQYNNAIYVCYPTAAANFTQTVIYTGAQSTGRPTIIHINANDICIVKRDMGCSDSPASTYQQTFLAMVCKNAFSVLQGTTAVLTLTGAAGLGLEAYWTNIIQSSGNDIQLFGCTSENSGCWMGLTIEFTPNHWSFVDYPIRGEGEISYSKGAISPHAAIDTLGTFHMVTSDSGNYASGIPSKLIREYVANLAANKISIDKLDTFGNFQARGCFDLGGVVYVFGATIINGYAFNAIMKLDGTIVYQQMRTGSTTSGGVNLLTGSANLRYNYGITAVYKGLYSVLFMSITENSTHNVICELLANGVVKEVATFDSGWQSYAQYNPVGIFEWGSKIFAFNPLGNKIWEMGTTRGTQAVMTGTGYLRLSDLGENTPNVNKSLYKVIIELSEALTSTNTISVYINGTLFGTIGIAHGTRAELQVSTTEFTGTMFKVELRYDLTATWIGQVEKILIQYVPIQLKKLAWGLGIRATKHLKLADGTIDTRLPSTMFSALDAAWKKNTPSVFTDVDGVTYNVIITDIDQRRPLLDRRGGDNQEALYFLEMLEV